MRSSLKRIRPGKNCIGLGVGAVILNSKQEILLIKRTNKITKDRTSVGMWSVPGGEVEFQERVGEAIHREVREEIGVEIEVKKFIGHWDQILPKSQVHWHCLSFLCKITKGTPKVLELNKFNQIKWFLLNKIPKNAGIAHIIAPLYLLGKISREELIKRLKETPES